MTDPSVMSFERPMFKYEAEEFGQFNITDLYFDFGVYFTVNFSKDPILLPPEIGTLRVIKLQNHTREELMPVNCTEQAF